LKIQGPIDKAAPLVPRREMLARFCQQALKSGCSLPDDYTAAEKCLIPDLIQPQWISEAALRNLEQMSLGEKAILRILDMLLNGVVPFPDPPPSSGAVAAALELSFPTSPRNAEEMACRVASLYEQNERFLKLRALAWLTLLDRWATAKLPQDPRRLDQILDNYLAAQWIVIIGLGLPLLKTIEAMLPLSLPGWNLRSIEYGLAPIPASTDGLYPGLAEGDLNPPFEKIDVINALIYERRLGFADMLKLARAELEAAFQSVVPKLDPGKWLVIFGDHAFRLAPDGQSISQGGTSTLERITPVLVLNSSV
jgi:hypothetical protein